SVAAGAGASAAGPRTVARASKPTRASAATGSQLVTRSRVIMGVPFNSSAALQGAAGINPPLVGSLIAGRADNRKVLFLARGFSDQHFQSLLQFRLTEHVAVECHFIN